MSYKNRPKIALSSPKKRIEDKDMALIAFGHNEEGRNKKILKDIKLIT